MIDTKINANSATSFHARMEEFKGNLRNYAGVRKQRTIEAKAYAAELRPLIAAEGQLYVDKAHFVLAKNNAALLTARAERLAMMAAEIEALTKS
jgi:hypothetical protein